MKWQLKQRPLRNEKNIMIKKKVCKLRKKNRDN